MAGTLEHSLQIRRARERGETRTSWLHGRHSFSFGRYYDPENMGFHSLRVLNDDIIAPGRGFGEHPHDNMEIITWVLDGTLEHRDSTGQRGVLGPGVAQRMSAGSGVRHSEVNASETEPLHLLQIWIEPAARNVTPRYDEKSFPRADRINRWQRIASGRPGDSGALHIHQDAHLDVADLERGGAVHADVAASRFGYLHVATGSVEIGGERLQAGDSAAFAGPSSREVRGIEDAQVLFFDLAG